MQGGKEVSVGRAGDSSPGKRGPDRGGVGRNGPPIARKGCGDHGKLCPRVRRRVRPQVTASSDVEGGGAEFARRASP